MNNTQEEWYGMHLKTSHFLDVHATDLTANPAIAAFKILLDGYIADILAQDVVANTDNRGYTDAKTTAYNNLLESVIHVGRGLKGYYRNPLNQEMLGKVNQPKSFYTDATEAELNTESEIIWRIADPVKTMLGPNLVTATNVNDLNTKRLAFLALMKVPKEKIGDGKAAREEMDRLFHQCNAALKGELDDLMAVYESVMPVLFSEYKSARAIDNFGGGSDSDGYNVQNFTIPANGSLIVSVGPGPVIGSQNIYIRAIHNNGILCVTNLPASPCTTGYNAVQGTTYKGPVSGLGIGFAGSHIQITNPGLSTLLIRIGFAS